MMKRSRRLLLLVLACVPANAWAGAAPSKFDLLCQRHEIGRPNDIFGPERFSIDMSKLSWCHAKCEEQEPLTATDDEMILGRRGVDPGWSGKSDDLATKAIINRKTAEYKFQIFQSGKLASETIGQCELKPYSGPGAERQF